MKTKLGASLIAALMMMGMFGVASATADPGPDTGQSEKGLCTAYFNGQKKGHDKQKERNGEAPGPFAGLEERAAEYDSSDDGDEDLYPEQQISDDVFEYCDTLYEILGQPEKNGRFDCREGEDREGAPHDSDDDGEVECNPDEVAPEA